MHRDSVVLDNFSVARAAIDGRRDGIAGSFVRRSHLGVALGTRYAGVRADVVGRLVHIQGNCGTLVVHSKTLISVAPQAVPIGCTQSGERLASDLVRLVALNARRDLVGLFLPQSTLDDLDVHFLDSRMAHHAGSGDVFAVNARSGIGMFEDIVRGVARGACRGHGQAFFEEPNAMNTLRVVLENSVLWNIAGHRDIGSLVMAAPTEQRNVQIRGGRIRVTAR